MLKTIKALCVAGVAAFTLASCSSSVSASDVEEQIKSQLKFNDGSYPDSASCPKDLPAEKGATMTCSVKAGGQDVDVKVTVTKVDGSDVSFDMETVSS